MNERSCPECGGVGYTVEDRNGALTAKPCVCRIPDRATRLVEQASIPQRYRRRYTFGNFHPDPSHPSQEDALTTARSYAENYPAVPEGANGLLFVGSCGVGKTHLAVAVLQEIVVRKAMPALFVDLNGLFRDLWNTYRNSHSEHTEYELMNPLVEAPLLLIDELGCLNSPWAQDTLHYLVSQRYNEQRPTLCTTNYLDNPGPGQPSLDERIGTRTRSRLLEMCQTVFLEGPDHRQR